MNYINENLLNDRLNVIKGINQIIEDSEGGVGSELYKIIVKHPEHIYKIFGKDYYTLTSINSLLNSLHHWVVDDGEYSIARKVNERLSTFNKRLGLDKEDTLHYDYSIQSGYGDDKDESCYVEVEDMIYLFKASIEAECFYEQNKDCIEGFNGKGIRECYLERRKKPYYQQWRELDKKGVNYLEEKFNERW